MTEATKVLQKVLAEITPSALERKEFETKINSFLKKLNSGLKKVNATAILGGSGAKDTWLAGNKDADIFVLFDYKEYKEKSAVLGDLLEKELKKLKLKVDRLHGSRDYFQFKEKENIFEIIPVLKIKDKKEMINITDASPLHADWVKSNSDKQLKDDIRLSKKFCRAHGCYGAESYISGFSGYVLEILTIRYGGFVPLLKESLKWKDKDVVDIKKYYQNAVEVFDKLNWSKVHSPLIVIDPVDKNRNAAAALSREKFYLFKKKAEEFLKAPSKQLFEKSEINLETVQKKAEGKPLVYLKITSFSGKEDVVGAKLLKAFEFLGKSLREFGVLKSGWEFDKKNTATFYFILREEEIAPIELRAGPPIRIEIAVTEFRKKHTEVFEKDGRLWARVRREQYKLKEFVEVILKDKFLKDKLKKIKYANTNEEIYNTKIELNGKISFLADLGGELEEKLFYYFIKNADKFILNDGGKDRKLKAELQPFDISQDKETGHEWTFKVNKNSKAVIIKTFKSYRTYPHLRWGLMGNTFSVYYEEWGDENELMNGPSGEKTVDKFFKITATKDALKKILTALNRYLIIR